MKVNYTYNDGFFHIYAQKLDNKDAIEQALQTIMDVIEKFVKMEKKEKQNPHFEMLVYEDGKMIDKKYDVNQKFWTKIATFKDCYPKVDEYVKVITSQLALDGYIWESEDLLLGGMASYKLALADKKYILFFISCLELCNTCPVEQVYFADLVIEHYGWCSETEMLFIAMLSSGAQYDYSDTESKLLESYSLSAEHPFFIRIINALEFFYGSKAEGIFNFIFESEEMHKFLKDYLKNKNI